MIIVNNNKVSFDGTKTELVTDLIALFIAFISKGHGHVIATSIGFVLEEGGKALDDKDD